MDLSPFYTINNPFVGAMFLISQGGWVIFVFMGLWMIKRLWLLWRQGIWEAKIEYVLLAVDIPKENEQSPKAVEQFFDHLTGFDKTPTLQEKFVDGFMPTKISLELVSIGGYIQFLIRTPVNFRDLVEAALYAEYPDAEITEVEDYINTVPKPDDYMKHWPNIDWKMWGAEIALYAPDPYPIKQWIEFEHGLSQELKDPMANILEILTRISPDEQVWIQWVIQTAGGQDRIKFLRKAKSLVKKLIGEEEKKNGFLGGFGEVPRNIFQGVSESITASLIPPSDFGADKKKDNGPINKMLYLTPGDRTIVEAIERKASKQAFIVKGRLMYFGRPAVFSKARGVSGVYGAIKQFNTNNLNGFAPPSKSKTEAWYVLVQYRTRLRIRSLLAGYRMRSNWAGHARFILNSEELATIWHFPVRTVKAQLVQKTESKRGGAPNELPLGDFSEAVTGKPKKEGQASVTDPKQKLDTTIPDNLPFV
jgi:hypothetical protein